MVEFRPAHRADSAVIAELYQMAAGGVADYIWTSLAEPGETILDAGTRRFAREGEAFSYQNCMIAEQAGKVLGMVHAFPMLEVSEVDDDEDPVLRPYCELESAPSLYIAGIACYEDARGQGIGTRLLDLTRRRAMSEGLAELSLIAFEESPAAVRLYLREGFEIVDRRAIVAHELIRYGGDALLMTEAL